MGSGSSNVPGWELGLLLGIVGTSLGNKQGTVVGLEVGGAQEVQGAPKRGGAGSQSETKLLVLVVAVTQVDGVWSWTGAGARTTAGAGARAWTLAWTGTGADTGAGTWP